MSMQRSGKMAVYDIIKEKHCVNTASDITNQINVQLSVQHVEIVKKKITGRKYAEIK